MDLEVIKTITPWLLGGCSVGGSLVAWAIKRSFATKQEVEHLKQEQKLIKSQVDNLPSHDEFYELKISIEAMRGDLKAINAALQPLQHINNLRLENDLKDKES
ncbi:DUF2730 family protein [Vibrio sp. LaRot3]|uniref:DUF2730 family protein n=1 Tax=Vibrio sp. LaRot3 TaxID=2998829 RepID=UPI0022CDFECC|nr:DUF2730 family protein [Vibrio sp. LaRot3]MDA0148841.1 DUF2730 family protein [Vibrio sp. LaRot3]